MNMQCRGLIAVSLLSYLVGCGASESTSHTSRVPSSTPAPMAPVMQNAKGITGPAESQSAAKRSVTTVTPTVLPNVVSRKIVYNADVSLNVESFDGIPAMVMQLTEECGGFVSGASLSGASGNQRSGRWTIRLPVEGYRTFLDTAGSIGEISSKSERTREVTAEFYDVEARIRNKQTEERRLIALLEQHPGELEDVLTFEKEISRVRGEIEVMQGRLRVLADLTALSTVNLQIAEVKTYVPLEAPTFATLVTRKWEATVEDLTGVGQWIILTSIGTVPWALIMTVFALPVYGLVRRLQSPGVS